MGADAAPSLTLTHEEPHIVLVQCARGGRVVEGGRVVVDRVKIGTVSLAVGSQR